MSGQDFSDPHGPGVQTSGDVLLDKLKVFCGESSRFCLDSPWFVDGKAIASDSRIMCWCEHEPFAFEGRRPGIAEFIACPGGLTWGPLPILPKCVACNNSGKVLVSECEACEGAGEVEHHCDCDLCDEETQDCDECDGKGKVDPPLNEDCEDCYLRRIIIDGMGFALALLRKITTLGPAEVAVDAGQHMLRFRCGVFSGCLMELHGHD